MNGGWEEDWREEEEEVGEGSEDPCAGEGVGGLQEPPPTPGLTNPSL